MLCSVADGELDDDALGAWRAFLTAHAHVTRARSAATSRTPGCPTSAGTTCCGRSTAQPERRLRVNELAREVVLSPTAMSRFVDRVEAAGYVRREPDPGDRRALQVALTDEGVALLRRMWPVYEAGIERHFAAYLGRSAPRGAGGARADGGLGAIGPGLRVVATSSANTASENIAKLIYNCNVTVPAPPAATDRQDAIDAVAGELVPAASRVTRLLLRRAPQRISRSDAGVLSALNGGPRRITELADLEGHAQPTMTLLVKRLEERGWVAREARSRRRPRRPRLAHRGRARRARRRPRGLPHRPARPPGRALRRRDRRAAHRDTCAGDAPRRAPAGRQHRMTSTTTPTPKRAGSSPSPRPSGRSPSPPSSRSWASGSSTRSCPPSPRTCTPRRARSSCCSPATSPSPASRCSSPARWPAASAPSARCSPASP